MIKFIWTRLPCVDSNYASFINIVIFLFQLSGNTDNVGPVNSKPSSHDHLPPPQHSRTRSSPSSLNEMQATSLTDPVTHEPIFGEIGRVSPRYETPPGTPTGPPGTPPPPYTVNANFATVSIKDRYYLFFPWRILFYPIPRLNHNS